MARARRCLAVGTTIFLVGVGRAHAEPSPRAVEASPGASLRATRGMPPDDTVRARQHYARAVGLYDAGAHAVALTEFQRAYALKPSYQLLFNIGQLELLLQRHAAARQSLERYLNEGGARVSAARRADVLQQLQALDAGTARGLGEGELHDRGPVRPAADVPRGAVRAVAAPLPGVPPSKSSSAATVAWVSTGALGLGALGTGIATLLTSRRYEQLRGTPAAPADARHARDRLDRQRALVSDLATVTDALAVATLAGATLSLYFTLWHGSTNEAEPELSLELTPGGVGATGSF